MTHVLKRKILVIFKLIADLGLKQLLWNQKFKSNSNDTFLPQNVCHVLTKKYWQQDMIFRPSSGISSRVLLYDETSYFNEYRNVFTCTNAVLYTVY